MLTAVAASAVAALAAACSSGGGSSSTPQASSSLTKSQIVIGAVGTYSGAAGAENVEVPAFEQAWAKWTNDNGGINGHPVKFVTVDDQDVAATAIAGVDNLVQNQKVVALVGPAEAGLETTWASYVQKAGVPVVGGDAYTPVWNTNPDFFLSTSDLTTAVYSGANLAARQGKTSYGVVNCNEESACVQAIKLHQAAAKAAGMKFVYGATAPDTAPNYTANCLAAKNAGAQTLSVGVGSPTAMSELATNCAQQGYKPLYVFNATSITPSLLTNPNVNGAIVPLTSFPWFYQGPETKDYQQVLALAGIGSQQNGPALALAYGADELFAKAASEVTGDVTSASLVNALYTMKGETLGGLVPPLTFTKGAATRSSTCYFVAEVQNGAMVAPQGLKTDCLSS
jgi:branched-chain amino acid transport system substrate-binding protein